MVQDVQPVPPQTADLQPPDTRPARPHAGDILGLNRPRVRTLQCSLEVEVELYLNDIETGTNSLTYWQASELKILQFLLLMNTKRKTNTDIQQYLPLPWIFYPSKHQLFLVSEFSLQARRQ